MRLVIAASWLALTILGGSLAVVRADDPLPTMGTEPPTRGGAATAIDRLAAALDASRFSERQSASEKLAALGAAAIPAMEKAAEGESLEVITRAIELLKKLLDSAEASTRTDARQALQRLAKTRRPTASRLAREVLKVKEAEDTLKAQQAAQFVNRQQFGPIQFAPGISARRVRVQNSNGGREIAIEETSRKIRINDGKGQPIKIEITTTTNGKDSTEKYQAKDVDELKKRHPQAHKFYQAWENQGNPFGFPAGVPIDIVQVQQPPDQVVREATEVLKELDQQIDAVSKGDHVQKASPQVRGELKQAVEQFQQTLAKVQKRLQEKPETPAAKPDTHREASKPR